MSSSEERLPEERLPELAGVITISLAAEMLGVSRQTAHQMTRDGRLPAWRIRSAGQDRPVVVREEDVLALTQRMQSVVSLPRITGSRR